MQRRSNNSSTPIIVVLATVLWLLLALAVLTGITAMTDVDTNDTATLHCMDADADEAGPDCAPPSATEPVVGSYTAAAAAIDHAAWQQTPTTQTLPVLHYAPSHSPPCPAV